MPQQLVIDAPVGYVGDPVEVLNYRMRPAVWEVGTIRDLRFTPGQDRPRHGGGTYRTEPRWTYEVWIEREITIDLYGKRKGGGYALTVGIGALRRLPCP